MDIKEINKLQQIIDSYDTIAMTKDYFGRTPIYFAAKYGRVDLCQLIAEKGVDL